MARKKPQVEDAAAQCGMDVEKWANVKQQAKSAKTRGRRPAGAAAESKLANWGDVDGQILLFPDDDRQGNGQ